MPTKFALEKVDVRMPDGRRIFFYFDGNGKVTRRNGSFDNPVPNAFSLVQVSDCPFATLICKSVCYVHRLEKAKAEIHAAYMHNSSVIREVLENREYFQETVTAFANWIRSHCSGGFRWNVSGDIISEKHARFIRKVCDEAPEIPFWLYTRSFAYLLPLFASRTHNLVVNLSADKDNYEEALFFHKKYGLRLCYLTVDGTLPDDLPDGSVIFPSHELRGRDLPRPEDASWWQTLDLRQKRMVCPPDFFGQSRNLRCGPCKKCLI